MKATYKDYLKLHFIVFLWGFTAILGKLISIPSAEMVFFRTLLAVAGMGALIIVRKGTFRITTTRLLQTLGVGFIVAIHWVSFFTSIKIANPSTALVGFATCSLWAAILEPIGKGEKINMLEVGLGILVFFGLGVIFFSDFSYPLGLVLGIVSGFTAALFSVINSHLVRHIHSYTITFYEMAGASIGVLMSFPIYMAAGHELQLNPSTADWVYIAILAWMCSVYAYSVALELMHKVSVFMIQLALNLEPLYGILLALLVFGKQEVMTLPFYIGSAIIVSSVVLYPALKKKLSRNTKPETTDT